MRKVVIDTETTGFSPGKGDRIVEIAGVEILYDKITGHCFQTYINPERDSHPKAEEVHGLSTEFLKSKPLFGDVARSFLRFVDGAEVIAHNAGFDVMFLNAEFTSHYGGSQHLLNWVDRITDTAPMAKKLFPGKKNSLDDLCKRYGVNADGRSKHHGALIDCQLLAEVYLKMLNNEDGVLPASHFPDVAERKGYDMSKHLARSK